MASKKRSREKGGAKISSPPVYMVVEHDTDEKPTHSVLKLEAGAVPRPLLTATHGMSFTTVGTPYGPRIVGVGRRRHLTAYDPKTSEEKEGPLLLHAKHRPVLVAHGNMLYALSRTPAVAGDLDFEPWFVTLDLDLSFTKNGSMTFLGWRDLPPPPIFPCRINPLEYRNPPEVRVAAYAVVGSCILLSVQQDKGTCAFDMGTEKWEMVDDMNLPFVGEAVPLGGHRFVARSKANDGAAAVYYMTVSPPRITGTGKTELFILELPVVSKCSIVPGQLLCALGNGSFSSLDVQPIDLAPEAKLAKARIVRRTYTLVEDNGTNADSVVIVKQPRQVANLLVRSHHLAHPSPVVAALTM